MKFFHKFIWIGIILIFAIPAFSAQEKGRFNITPFGGYIRLVGGSADNTMISPWMGLSLGYNLTNRIALEGEFAYGKNKPADPDSRWKAHADTPFETSLMPLSLNMRYNFRSDKKIAPYLLFGAGGIHWQLENDGEKVDFSVKKMGIDWINNITLQTGLGVNFAVAKNFGIETSFRYHQLIEQKQNMSGVGDISTGIFETRLGLQFSWGGKKDSDNDGFSDDKDDCPKLAEDFDNYSDSDGCPEKDNDLDGIEDKFDKCPNQPEDFDGKMDDDGCPDGDNDGDGISDEKDKCINEPEDYDGYQDLDGCPDIDIDADGIPDDLDQCIDEAEIFNGFQDEDGCPDEKPGEKPKETSYLNQENLQITEPIYFQSKEISLPEEAKSTLDILAYSMANNPAIRVEMRGHSDNQGDRVNNMILSLKRAQAGRLYVVRKGIDANRIRVLGFGDEYPVASNATEEGRARNRRVEFIITK